MSDEEIREVIEGHRQFLVNAMIEKEEYPANFPVDDLASFSVERPTLAHCHFMLEEMILFLEEGKREKVLRWLGFVQGVLWAEGVYTIEGLKSQNKPSEK